MPGVGWQYCENGHPNTAFGGDPCPGCNQDKVFIPPFTDPWWPPGPPGGWAHRNGKRYRARLVTSEPFWTWIECDEQGNFIP